MWGCDGNVALVASRVRPHYQRQAPRDVPINRARCSTASPKMSNRARVARRRVSTAHRQPAGCWRTFANVSPGARTITRCHATVRIPACHIGLSNLRELRIDARGAIASLLYLMNAKKGRDLFDAAHAFFVPSKRHSTNRSRSTRASWC